MSEDKPTSLRDELLSEIERERTRPTRASRPTETFDSQEEPAAGTEPSAGNSRPSSAAAGRSVRERPGSGESAVGPACRDVLGALPDDEGLDPSSVVPAREFLSQL